MCTPVIWFLSQRLSHFCRFWSVSTIFLFLLCSCRSGSLIRFRLWSFFPLSWIFFTSTSLTQSSWLSLTYWFNCWCISHIILSWDFLKVFIRQCSYLVSRYQIDFYILRFAYFRKHLHLVIFYHSKALLCTKIWLWFVSLRLYFSFTFNRSLWAFVNTHSYNKRTSTNNSLDLFSLQWKNWVGIESCLLVTET